MIDHDLRPLHAADAPPWWARLTTKRLAVGLGSTFLALPILILDNVSSQPPSAEALELVGAPTTSESTSSTTSSTSSTTTAPSSTTITVVTTAPPSTAAIRATTSTTLPAPTTVTAPPTTAAPPVTAAPPTTAAPPATAAPPTTATPAPATAAPPAPANEQAGKATWYYWNPGECAHRTIPKGTTVTVVNARTGARTTCVVTDRGPYGAGRIIDLDESVFAQIAPLSAGVIDVYIAW